MLSLDKFFGLGVAIITPFDKYKQVDYNSLDKLLNHVLKEKISYLVVHGTTGECVTTTDEEKLTILNFISKKNVNKIPIVYGLGGNNTKSILENLKNLNFECIDAILSISPYYNKPSQIGIYQHYVEIADASPKPVILYNAPSRTGANIQADTTLKLSLHNNIIGIKESSGDINQCSKIAFNKPKDFLLISGDDSMLLPIISIGGVGLISVLANAFPKEYSSAVNYAINGNFSKARYLILKFIELDDLMYLEGNPVGIKQLLDCQTICKPFVRKPLHDASIDLQSKIKKSLKKI